MTKGGEARETYTIDCMEELVQADDAVCGVEMGCILSIDALKPEIEQKHFAELEMKHKFFSDLGVTARTQAQSQNTAAYSRASLLRNLLPGNWKC